MIQDIQCTVGLSCVAVITENTHDRPCNMHGYFGLHYSFRHHPDSEVFRQLHQRFCERGISEYRSPTDSVETANGNVIIAPVE